MSYHLLLCYLWAFLLLIACDNPTKNPDPITLEEGTTVTDAPEEAEPSTPEAAPAQPELGYWVGDFKNAVEDYSKDVVVGDGFYWNRTNKITIALDKIEGDQVWGHSVVAGNDRPFEGTRTRLDDGTYRYEVKEPGDDRYDGTFEFVIQADQVMVGTWKAYKKIDISQRKYQLKQRTFAYDPDVELVANRYYVEWDKTIETEEEETYPDGSVEAWISKEYATATQEIYTLNASNTALTKAQVENLKRGDLTIIRNAIYARHGYSFKNRPLRVFFDAQPWYMPVHTDIRSDFTELEKANIELLLRYEKNAAEYYDRFGRG